MGETAEIESGSLVKKIIYNNLIINQRNWKQLTRSVRRGKLPHALLFHGGNGCGKEGHAIELAALINCETPTDNGACGNCPSCTKVRTFQHGNIKLILPFPRGKISTLDDPSIRALTDKNLEHYQNMLHQKGIDPYSKIQIDNARTILINSIRELKRDIYMSTIDQGWSIILIFDAEKLCVPQPMAANALLKVLEEPPEKTIFILITSEQSVMLDTIKSRCQQFYFPPVTSSDILQVLGDQDMTVEQKLVIANIANGDIRLAKSLVEGIDDLFSDMKRVIKALYSSNSSAWQDLITRISLIKRKGNAELQYFFRAVILYFRDLQYYADTSNKNGLIFTNLETHFQKITTSYPSADWSKSIEIIENTIDHIQRNGYVPLMISTMLIELHSILRVELDKPFSIHDWLEI